jgi:hypothetical protein
MNREHLLQVTEITMDNHIKTIIRRDKKVEGHKGMVDNLVMHERAQMPILLMLK